MAWVPPGWHGPGWQPDGWQPGDEGEAPVAGDTSGADPYKRVERKMKRRARGLDTIYMGEHNRHRKP